MRAKPKLTTLFLLLISVNLEAAFERIDISADSWNSAKLAELDELELRLTYLELHNLIGYSFIEVAMPVKSVGTVGVGISSSGSEMGFYQERIIDFSIGRAMGESFLLGAKLSYLTSTASMAETPVGDGHGFSIDVGIRYRFLEGKIPIDIAFSDFLSRVNYSRADVRNAPAKKYIEKLEPKFSIGTAINLGIISDRLSPTTATFELLNGSTELALEYIFRSISFQLGYKFTKGISRGIRSGFSYRHDNLKISYNFAPARDGLLPSLSFTLIIYPQ